MIYILKTYWKSLIITIIIIYLSLFHAPDLSEFIETFDGIDKMYHSLAYVALAFCLHWDCYNANISKHKKYILCIIVPILLGGLIEILQQNFFPPRTGEWLDFAADTAGTLVGFFLFYAFLPILKKLKLARA